MLASCKLIFKTYISWLIDFHERWWKGREVISSYSRNVSCVSLVEVVNFGLMMTWPSSCWCVSLLWLSTSEFSLWRRVEILLDAFPLLTKRITWLCPSFSCVLISSCRTFCIPGMNPKTSLLWLENYLRIDFWSFILSVWWKHGFLKFLMFTDQWPCLPIRLRLSFHSSLSSVVSSWPSSNSKQTVDDIFCTCDPCARSWSALESTPSPPLLQVGISLCS